MADDFMHADSALPEPSEEQLAIEAQAGSMASFERLVGRVQVPLVHFLIRRTPCPADAEDLAQEALVRAFRSLARYSPKWRFRTWLFTIAHRLSINLAERRRHDLPSSDVLDSIAGRSHDPSDRLAAEESRQSLWAIAERRLDREQVSALWLHYVEDLTTAEIAGVLGRSRVAVKTMLFRARRRLMPHLKALVESESTEKTPAPFDGEAGQYLLKVANV